MVLENFDNKYYHIYEKTDAQNQINFPLLLAGK